MDTWDDYVAAIGTGLSRLTITDKNGETLTVADGFGRWVEMTHQVHTHGRHVYLVGNGASAAMACGLRPSMTARC
jgi:hypothetical protein